MKNNRPQLHVTSTLIARESITLNVISMNTERIHTPWLGLVRGASRGFGRGLGGLGASAAVGGCAVPASVPWQLGSYRDPARALEVKVQLLNGEKSNKRESAPVLKPSSSTKRCLLAPGSCRRTARVSLIPHHLLLPALLGKAKYHC